MSSAIRLSLRLAATLLFLLGLQLLTSSGLAAPQLAGPPNVITNPDFSDGTNHWTASIGNIAVPGSCATGMAEVYNVATANVDQCIHITNPPASNNWTLSVGTINIISGDNAWVNALFYTSSDCSGVGGDMLTATTAGVPVSGIRAGKNSVKVTMVADSVMGSTDVCFDNLSLGGTGATVVNLERFTQQSGSNYTTNYLLATVMVLGSVGLAILSFKRRPA